MIAYSGGGVLADLIPPVAHIDTHILESDQQGRQVLDVEIEVGARRLKTLVVDVEDSVVVAGVPPREGRVPPDVTDERILRRPTVR